MSIYDFEYRSIEGNPVKMAEYAGKVVLIVNTASACGFTHQYQGLEELYRTYKERGLVVLGFPCNQFNEQEPGTETEIAEFCSVRYGVTFPLSQKVDVRDETAIPLYKYLTAQKGFAGLDERPELEKFIALLKNKYGSGYTDAQIKWNFTKFLIDREGNVAARYESPVEPKEIARDIEKLL